MAGIFVAAARRIRLRPKAANERFSLVVPVA